MSIRPFQIALLVGFALLAVVGLVLLSGFEVAEEETATVPLQAGVEIWGTLPAAGFEQAIREAADEDENFANVSYRQVDARSFENTLVNAIADGRSPDLLAIPHRYLVSLRSKLIPLQEDSYPARTFRTQFVDGAEVFQMSDGIYALPLAVDPLMMYWNRDLFASAGVATPPVYWRDVTNQVVPELTIEQADRTISQSAIAFGEIRNVQNAEPVLLTLAMQSGSGLITETSRGYQIALNESPTGGRDPFLSAVDYYTSFSNANSPRYSWNRAQRLDRDAFVANDLALYFGMASELSTLRRLNPNLNFDVAAIPQGQGATAKRVFGDFYGLTIPRAASNPSGAFIAAQRLTGPSLAASIAETMQMAPVHRSLIAAGDTDPFRATIMEEALIARGWLNPDPAGVTDAMARMLDDINASRKKVSVAVKEFIERLRLLF